MLDNNIVLETEIFGNSISMYIAAIAVAAFIYISTQLFKRFLISRIAKLSKKTDTRFDDVLIESIKKIGNQFYIVIALYTGSVILSLHSFIDSTLLFLTVIVCAYYIVRLLENVTALAIRKTFEINAEDSEVDTSILHVVTMTAKVIIWLGTILLILQNFGINVLTIVGGLGIGGIAIAFALQSVLEDVFSSFSIYFDKPFKTDDYIMIGDQSGTVKKVGIKTTRIQTLDGDELVVANKELTTSQVRNYKKMQERRILFRIGVVYGTTREQLEKIPTIIESIIRDTPNATFDRSHFFEFGDFSLNVETVYYVSDREYVTYMNAQQSINLRIMKAFEEEGIEFAFPTQTVNIEKS